jgi:hypothetical protein
MNVFAFMRNLNPAAAAEQGNAFTDNAQLCIKDHANGTADFLNLYMM